MVNGHANRNTRIRKAATESEYGDVTSACVTCALSNGPSTLEEVTVSIESRQRQAQFEVNQRAPLILTCKFVASDYTWR